MFAKQHKSLVLIYNVGIFYLQKFLTYFNAYLLSK